MVLTVRYISVDDISDVFLGELFEDELRGQAKREEYFSFFNSLDASLIVELLSDGSYRLITGHSDYLIYQNYDVEDIPCRICEFRTNQERLIHLFAHELKNSKSTSWLLKHNLLNNLLETGIDIPSIARSIHETENEIVKYTIIDDVPQVFHVLAIQHNASTTINSMGRFFRDEHSLHHQVQESLYRLAVLPNNNVNRLIYRRWNILSQAIDHASNLSLLTVSEQTNWIQLLFDYEDIIFRTSQAFINELIYTPSTLTIKANLSSHKFIAQCI